MTLIQLKPSEIYYSQDTIASCFSDGYTKIGETLDKLYEGRLDVHDIPIISVTQIKYWLAQSRWVTMDNRRLWIFKHLERLGKCNKITVLVESDPIENKLTTTCHGTDVKVRGEPGGSCYKKYSWSFLSPGIIAVAALTIIGALVRK